MQSAFEIRRAQADCKSALRFGCGWAALVLLLLCLFLAGAAQAQPAAGPAATNQIIVVVIQGKVEVSPAGTARWFLASTNQVLQAGDLVRTGERSRTVLRWSNLTLMPLDERSFIEIPSDPKSPLLLRLLRGTLYFFHRDKPGVFPVGTPTMSAVVRGTEFNLHVAEDGTSTLHLLDGKVEMRNASGELVLKSGEAGRAEPCQAPARTAALTAMNVIQWCLYYPGVLDLDELTLTAEEQAALREPLAAYRSGELLAALASYPEGRQPASSEEKVYLAALLLAVGQVGQAEALLTEVRGQKTEVRGQRSGVRLGDWRGRCAGSSRR